MRVDVARSLSSDASDVEPSRAFLQDRIGLWAFWIFVLSFGFYLVQILTLPLVNRGTHDLGSWLVQTGNLDHLAASLVFGGTFLLTRYGPLSMRALRTLDMTALIAGCLLFAVMGAFLGRLPLAPGLELAIGSYAGLLACSNAVVARAITVPSTARRTLLGSSVAMVPLVPMSLAVTGIPAATINLVAWCAVSIAIATIGSRVIFGLRSEAARVRRLGQYTLERKIGEGGMGVVYRASHALLRRPTAIKLLPSDRAGEASISRFEREVQMTAELSHPNTVAIYDFGRTPDGLFYYAMEYLDGITLEDLVRRDGALPPGRVRALLEQVCGALAEAHGRGLVHRDIKPANIILSERGGEPDVAKVVDFGLVKQLAPGGPAATFAGSGVLTGTPLYMSPEALTMPGEGDPRSDLYALGAVAYFLLSGRPVFEAGTVAEIIAHHLRSEPAPLFDRARSPVPRDLEAVVLQCLRKSPDERPQSARALRGLLRECADVPPWTEEHAAAWWREFHASGAPAVRTAADARALTVTVDLSDRLAEVTHAAS